MTDEFCLQGVASEFDKPFVHGDHVLILQSDCFSKSLRSSDIKLLLNHDTSHCLGSQDRLMIYAGEKSLVFRFPLSGPGFKELADDFETYVPVSVGYITKETETTIIDGSKLLRFWKVS